MPDGRRARSWFWMKQTWRLFRDDRSLLAIAGLATVLNLVAAAIIFGVSTYCNVALLRLAQARFDGGQATLGDGFRAANRRLPAILGWSLVSVLVGFLFNAVAERVPFGGAILAWIGGIAWSLATMFAVPVLALEDAGPLQAPRRSLQIFRARWGEGVIGSAGVGAVTAVAIVPGILLVSVGIAVGGAAGIALAVLGALVIALAITAGRAMDQLYALAIYRHEVAGQTTFGLSAEQLNDFMKLKPRRGRR